MRNKKRIALILRIITIIITAPTGYLLFTQKLSPYIAIPLLLVTMFLPVVAEILLIDFSNNKEKRKSKFRIIHLAYVGIILIIILVALSIRLFTTR